MIDTKDSEYRIEYTFDTKNISEKEHDEFYEVLNRELGVSECDWFENEGTLYVDGNHFEINLDSIRDSLFMITNRPIHCDVRIYTYKPVESTKVITVDDYPNQRVERMNSV